MNDQETVERYNYSIGFILGYLENSFPFMEEQIKQQSIFLRSQAEFDLKRLKDAVDFVKSVQLQHQDQGPAATAPAMNERGGIPMIDAVPVGQGALEYLEKKCDQFIAGDVPLGDFYAANETFQRKMVVFAAKIEQVRKKSEGFFMDGGL